MGDLKFLGHPNPWVLCTWLARLPWNGTIGGVQGSIAQTVSLDRSTTHRVRSGKRVGSALFGYDLYLALIGKSYF